MSRGVRVAIAGTGFIGAVHARSARLAGARVVGVAASTPERSARAAEKLGAERAFESAEGLVAVPFAYRFYPTVREARERVRTGATGPLRLLHGTYLQDWLARPEDDNW